jgi:isoquinoline 1-oxidoreductase subunit beta
LSRNLTRRDFVKASVTVGAGLLVGVRLPDAAAATPEEAHGKPFVPDAWIRISPDNRVTLVLDRVEMGQGTMTSHAMLVAEELEIEPAALNIEFAPASRVYDNPDIGFQLTGGSTSVKTSWLPLREGASAARETLRLAAARTWQVRVEDCAARSGTVVHTPSARTATYGDLAVAASALSLQAPRLKDPKDFHVVGKSIQRVDAGLKVTGKAVYGIDVQVPGMLVAAIARSPVVGGSLKTFDASEAKASSGVEQVLPVPNGVAVVAKTYWEARAAAAKLRITWNEGVNAGLSTDRLFARWRGLFATGRAKPAKRSGSVKTGLSRSANTIESTYEVPYLAHATMEPPNATARVGPDDCEVWAPTQGPAQAREVAALVSGVPYDKVQIHTTFLGGGFGRRISQDFVAEAVFIAKAVGKPVKVVWSREDDIQHDVYRPASVSRLRAGLDSEGRITAWEHRIVGPSILAQVGPNFLSNMLPVWIPGAVKGAMGHALSGAFGKYITDDNAVEGANNFAYAIDNQLVEFVDDDPGIPIGFWRSVGNSINTFVVESFIDELAHAAGQDPYQFRRKLLGKAPRNRAALDLAADKAGWGSPLPEGVFRGIAQHQCFGSYVAEVAEVSVANDQIRVLRVVCVIDCGRAINPNLVHAQLESAVVFGLSAALKGRVTFERGRVQQSNFHDYEVLRMDEMPKVEAYIIPSEEPPTGVGEPGVPPIAAAVANAVFAATKKRLRRLPLSLADA